MNIYMKEKIGNPYLFSGRKKELTSLLDWADKAKIEISKSTAILSRRKTGKSVLMHRFYNLLFDKNDTIVPFYFEIQEKKQWIGDFSMNLFFGFMYQYIAFKTRKATYIDFGYGKKDYSQLINIIKSEKLDYLLHFVENFQFEMNNNRYDSAWDVARDMPRLLAGVTNETIIQMIDEFQFLNRYIYNDIDKKKPINDFAGTYLHTCEYKNAPFLVSGSWVGWLMDDLSRLLPGRFIKRPLNNIDKEDAREMIYRYSMLTGIPVTEEVVYLMAQLTEGSPFYISALFDSIYEHKDLTTKKGLLKTLEFETLNLDGSINATWMEYLDAALPRINELHSKNIVLYLSKNKDKKIGRRDLKKELNIDMNDIELEKKLKALYRSDIIEEDRGFYQGVQDNIFEKVFRRTYEDDIDQFLENEAVEGYNRLLEHWQTKFKQLQGKYNRYKGAYAELMVWNNLKLAHLDQEKYLATINNLPDDFVFCDYKYITSFTSPPLSKLEFQVDAYAIPVSLGKPLIAEVKDRKQTFSEKEASLFVKKAKALMELEKINTALLMVISTGGFTASAYDFMKKNSIAWSDDIVWINRVNKL